ncbi:MAG: chorismate synthase, partial [Treponema sp.]|nr:chorismate synthase [Treponema sp.]
GAEKALTKLEEIRKEGDSAGGCISCLITGVPAGFGEPVFDKLDARLAAAMLSIGACKGIEFGDGFASAEKKGSEKNNIFGFPPDADSPNSSDGILGGISTGQNIYFTAAFKPTPSFGKPQKVMDRQGSTKEIAIKGRHDVCIVPRAVPVAEAMAALTLADFLLLSRSAKV